ncbi:phage antirepressor KilAC domain-containing protein [Streptomyces aurantiogriseus]|uniref:Antirepressor protein C-terminal domain-containing protein n=1 Tax=Streptomyces aurantiogriseus TaxID=66870 RepID=A0A918CHE2_9ACTN|nr:phage antirepressor KilAC domain-containing protein [Streptomyces aurantiogriseus]GGR24014.1 hypothetical protein GCM10010251_45110 [Streptomyces aurantiogriseus]
MASIASTNELALTESRSMRDQTIERTDVLDKVKTLITLPNGFHVTTDMVANYFEVPVETIKSVVEDHRTELEERGYRVLKGAELTEFASPFGGPANLGLSPMARSLALFTRKAVLNVGQLLTKSKVSKAIRTYLLDVEEQQTTFQIPRSFAEALELAAAQARELEQATAALEAAAPKIEVYDRLIDNGIDRTLRDTVKILKQQGRGITETELRNKLVHEWGWVFVTQAECGAVQYSPYASKTDYLSLSEGLNPHRNCEDCWHTTLKVTPRGREAILRKLNRQKAEPAAPVSFRTIASEPTEAEIFSMIRRGA